MPDIEQQRKDVQALEVLDKQLQVLIKDRICRQGASACGESFGAIRTPCVPNKPGTSGFPFATPKEVRATCGDKKFKWYVLTSVMMTENLNVESFSQLTQF